MSRLFLLLSSTARAHVQPIDQLEKPLLPIEKLDDFDMDALEQLEDGSQEETPSKRKRTALRVRMRREALDAASAGQRGASNSCACD